MPDLDDFHCLHQSKNGLATFRRDLIAVTLRETQPIECSATAARPAAAVASSEGWRTVMVISATAANQETSRCRASEAEPCATMASFLSAGGDSSASMPQVEHGTAESVQVYKSPNDQVTTAMAYILTNADYKPGKCHGIPCTMNDLFELDFSVR